MSELNPLRMLTSTEFVIDTNVAIALINDPQAAKLRVPRGARVFAPVIVIGELYFGAAKSQRVGENLAKVEDFAGSVGILAIDLAVSRRYGEMRQWLEARGRRIPENDMWIAGTALVHGLPLVTADQHFANVEGLTILKW